MGKTNRLKDRVKNATTAGKKKKAKQPVKEEVKQIPDRKEPVAANEETKDLEPKQPDPDTKAPPVVEMEAGTVYKMKPFDKEMSAKFARRVDNLTCVLITLAVRTRRKAFKLTLEEMEAIEFGDSMMDIVNWYLPQLDLNSPWPPAIMAILGLGAVVVAKVGETPKNSKKAKESTQQTTPPAEKPTEPKKPGPTGNEGEPVASDSGKSGLENKVV